MAKKELLEKTDLESKYRLQHEYYAKIEKQLNSNEGNCWLKNPQVARFVAEALRYFNGKRYELHAWIIMPNHVHVLLTTFDGEDLSAVTHSWKSYTANRANQFLRRSGRFWEPESFDRLVKSERHFEFCIRYILNNPVKAGLCSDPFQWGWYGISPEIADLVKRFFV